MVTLIKSFLREHFLEGICVSSVRITRKRGCPGEAPASIGPGGLTLPRSHAQENWRASSPVEDLGAGPAVRPTASAGSFPASPSSDRGPSTAPETLLTRVGHWVRWTPA